MRRDDQPSIAWSMLGRRARGEQQPLAAGVAHRQVQPALVVLQPVAGEVQQGEVVPAAPGVEVADRLTDHVVRLVDQHRDVEAGDVRVLEDGGEGLRVVLRGGEPAQAGVPVVVRGDDERLAAVGHGLTPAGDDGRTCRSAWPAPPGEAPLELQRVAVDGQGDLVAARPAGPASPSRWPTTIAQTPPLALSVTSSSVGRRGVDALRARRPRLPGGNR